MMKYKISMLSIAMATIVLVSMSAVAGGSAAHASTVGAPIAGAPAVCYDANGNEFVFAQGYNGQLWAFSPNVNIGGGATGTWVSLGGVLTSGPAAVSQGYNSITGLDQVTVFVRGSDGFLYSKTTIDDGATWSAWTTWPGHVAAGTSPAVSSSVTVNGILIQTDVFYVDSASHHLMWDWTTATNAGSGDLGGIVTASPGVVATSTGVPDVFVRGTSGALYEKVSGMGGWPSSWTKFNRGVLAAGTGPTAVLDPATGHLYLFVTGTDSHMYLQYSTDDGLSWMDGCNVFHPNVLCWVNLGGVLTSSPSAAYTGAATDTMVVMARGSSGDIWLNTNVVGGVTQWPANVATAWSGWSYDITGP